MPRILPSMDLPRPASQMDDIPPAPLAGTRAEAIQRLQVGLIGLSLMVLMVGLANIIMERAKLTDESVATPEAVAAPAEPVATKNDPLVDAGVAPELPVEPTPTASPTQTQPTSRAAATADVPPAETAR